MKRLRLFALALACALGAGVGTALADDQKPVTIEYWHVNTESFGGPAVRELVAMFQQKYPGITVEEHFQPNTYTGLLENLQTRIAAKNPPDVAQIGYLYVDYVTKNFPYVPVGDLLGAQQTAFLANFPKSVERLGTRNGKLVGMPYALSNILTYYNADMLKAAGLNPDSPPQTWDDWAKAATVIKQKTGKPGIYIQVLDDNWSTQSMIESAGGRMLQCSGGQWKAAFDSPKAAAGIQFWADQVKNGNALNVLWNQGEQAFLAGQVATFVTTIGKRNNLQKNATFDLRGTTFPTFAGSPARLPGGGNVLMVFSQDPAKRDAALKFIQFLESPEAFAVWTKGTGYIPFNNDERPLGDFLKSNPIERIAIKQTADTVPWTSFPGKNGLAAQQALFNALQRSLAGQATAADALHDAANTVNGLIAGESCTP